MAKQAQVEIVLSMVDKTTKGLNSVSSASKKLSQNMKKLGTSMTRNVTLPLVALGVGAVKASMDLDKSMRNIQAFGGQTEDQLKDLSNQFREMSKDINKTTDSAKGLADAYFNIQSAGFLAEDGMEVLSVSTKAATAGLTSTTKASEGVMAILNAYGLTAKEAAAVSDSLFTTIKFGVGTFEQLTPVLGKVIPIAASMGIAFDEVNASLATISKAGVDFTTGATQIARTMTSMLSPSEALQEHMEGLGFASGQAMVDALGLNRALQMIADSVGNDTTKLNKLFVETRAFQGVLNLTGKNARVFNQIMGEMANKVGATDEAFQQQIKSTSAQLKNLKNIVTDAFITLGDAILPVLVPILQKVAKAIGDVATWFKSLDPGIQKAIVSFGLFITVAGPIISIVGGIIGVFGTLIGAVSSIVGAFGAVTAVITGTSAAIPALATAFGFLLGPIGLVAAGIAGLIAFGPQIKNFVTGAVNGIKRLLGFDVGKSVTDKFMDLAKGIQQFADQNNIAAEKVGTAWKTATEAGAHDFQEWSNAVKIVMQQNQLTFAQAATHIQQINSQAAQGMVATSAQAGQAIAGNMAQGAIVGARAVQQVYSQVAAQVGRIQLGNKIPGLSAQQKQAASAAQFSLAEKIRAQISGGSSSGGFGGGFSAPSFGGGMSLVDRVKAAVSSPDFSGADKTALQLAIGGGAGGGSGGGNINITIEEMVLPPGTTKEIADEVLDLLGTQMRRKGFTGVSVG